VSPLGPLPSSPGQPGLDNSIVYDGNLKKKLKWRVQSPSCHPWLCKEDEIIHVVILKA
jgi:hypothetical protein